MGISIDSPQAQSWLIYSLGGGWGHLIRSLSLGRIAARSRSVKILTNSPYVAYLQDQLPELGCQLEAIAPHTSFTRTCEQVREVLLNSDYDCLIVDTFPRGLGGELADILPQLKHIPRILIHRDLKPEYVEKFGLRSFVTQHFNAVIVPGDGEDLPLSDLSIVQHTRPWLIRNAEELPDITTARRLLVKDTQEINNSPRPIILVCAAGKKSELPLFGAITQHLAAAFPDAAVRCLSPIFPTGCPPDLWISHFPGIECFRGADVVVGGAGYNTVYECAALGVPLLAFALKRIYDRQERRIKATSYEIKDLEIAIATIESLLNQQQQGINRHQVNYINGAVEAVGLIEQAIAINRREF